MLEVLHAPGRAWGLLLVRKHPVPSADAQWTLTISDRPEPILQHTADQPI